MANNCKNCGGFLRYDISSGMLKCDSCDSTFTVESYDAETNAEETHKKDNDYEVTIYICPSCGAEISSTESAALEYCLYCGSFVTLDTQLANVKRPDKIIPFARTKEDCKAAYRKRLSHNLYAPGEFKKEEFLDGFKGIYIPYWNYAYDMGPDFNLTGKESHMDGDYQITQHYNVHCEGKGSLRGLNYDASSTFDDSISARIARISEDKTKPFRPGYMFGFFGDTADVEHETYDLSADDTAGNILWKAVDKDPRVKKENPIKPDEDEIHKVKKHIKNKGKEPDSTEEIKTDNTILQSLKTKRQISLTMVPVWFLTWRKGDQVAYSVVNGDTGEIYSEVPVDTVKYLLLSILTAIPLFFLLNVMVTFNGDDILLMSLLLSNLFIILYSTELERIVKRTFHIGDKGFEARHQKEKTKYSDNLLLEALSFIAEFFFLDGIMGYVFLVIALFLALDIVAIVIAVLAIAGPIYSVWRIVKNQKLLNEPLLILDISGSLLAVLISIFVFFTDPASDIFYYGCGIVCLLGIAVTTVLSMRRYNEVITRPVPHFFDRKEGEEA